MVTDTDHYTILFINNSIIRIIFNNHTNNLKRDEIMFKRGYWLFKIQYQTLLFPRKWKSYFSKEISALTLFII